MKELVLDASGWRSRDDLYEAFFAIVQAPAWHGRNLNAVRDSIDAGGINGVKVPYRLVVRNYRLVPESLRAEVEQFAETVRALAREGVRVDIRLEE